MCFQVICSNLHSCSQCVCKERCMPHAPALATPSVVSLHSRGSSTRIQVHIFCTKAFCVFQAPCVYAFSSRACASYTHMYTLHVHVFAFIYLHTLHIYVYASYTCIRFIYMHTLHRHAYASYICIRFIYMYTLHIHAYAS